MKYLPTRWNPRLAASVLVLANLAVYAPTLNFRWVYFDDVSALDTDRQATGGRGQLWAWLSTASRDPWHAPLAFVSGRSLTNFSRAFDATVFGEDPWGHRLHNVLLHLAATLAVGAAAEAMLGSIGWGLFAALIFSLHPLQTESVVYIAGRRDVLSGALGLAGFALWARAGPDDRRSLGAAAGLWLAALCAKPSAVAWPVIAWAYDLLLRAPRPRASRRAALAALTTAGAGAAAVVAYLLRTPVETQARLGGSSFVWFGGRAAAQWATEPRLLLLALRVTVWPFPQCADYSRGAIAPSLSFSDPRTLTALAWLAAAFLAAVAAARRDRIIGFSLIAAAVGYLPMVHLLPSSHNSEVFAEHWLYLPLFGASLAAARFLQRNLRGRVSVALAATLVAVCAGANAARARVWRDDLVFWSEAVRAQPLCARAYSGLGHAFQLRGQSARAEKYYLSALALTPDDPRPRMSIAQLLIDEGRLPEARGVLLATRRLAGLPFLSVREIQSQLGRVALLEGNPREALRLLDASFSSDAKDARGWARIDLGEWDEAAAAFGEAVRTDPFWGKARADLGLALLNTGRPAEAATTLREALRLETRDIDAQINLGLSLARTGRFAEARALLTDAARREPRSEAAFACLSETERLAGLRRPALAWARKAVALGGSAQARLQLELATAGR